MTVSTQENTQVVKVASLDEALLLTGFGAYNILNMLLCGIIFLGMIMQTMGLSYILPAAQCDLALTLQQKGLVAAIPFIAIILTSHLWGWLADTRGRKPIILYTMILAVIFGILSSFSPNIYVFAVLQFLACIFVSATSSVVYAYLGENNSNRYRDRMVTFGAAFVGLGIMNLPAVSWLILPMEWSYSIPFLGILYRPWRLQVVISTVPFIVSCICMIWAAESPKYLYSVGRREECLELLKRMYAINHRSSVEEFPVKSLEVNPNPAPVSEKVGLGAIWESLIEQTIPLFKMPLLPWTCLACFVQFGLMAIANGFYIWFPTILNSIAKHTGNETGICNILTANSHATANSTEGLQQVCIDTVNIETFKRALVVGLGFFSVYIIVGTIVDYVGKKIILIIVIGVSGLCGITTHLASNQQLAVALFTGFQMSGACIGLLTAVVVDIYPTNYRVLTINLASVLESKIADALFVAKSIWVSFVRSIVTLAAFPLCISAMAVCISMMMGRVGAVFATNSVGVLLEDNCALSFYLFGGLLIVCSLLCFTLPERKKIKKHEKIVDDANHNQSAEEA